MYDHQQLDIHIGGILDMSGANTVVGMVGSQNHVVRSLYASVTIAQTVAIATLTFRARPTVNSNTNAITLGTLAIPIGTAIGKCVVKDITPVVVPPGYELAVTSDGGGDAGSAQCGVRAYPKWETPANNTTVVVSA